MCAMPKTEASFAPRERRLNTAIIESKFDCSRPLGSGNLWQHGMAARFGRFKKLYTTLTSPLAVQMATRGRYGGVGLCLAPLIHLLRGPRARVGRP